MKNSLIGIRDQQRTVGWHHGYQRGFAISSNEVLHVWHIPNSRGGMSINGNHGISLIFPPFQLSPGLYIAPSAPNMYNMASLSAQ